MIRIVMTSFGLSANNYLTSSVVCSNRRFFGSLHTAAKVAIKWQHMSGSKSLAEKARSLIFGEKKYIDLSPQEQKIVDFYQQRKLEEDGVVLPNTRAALEQAEVEQILLKRHRNEE